MKTFLQFVVVMAILVTSQPVLPGQTPATAAVMREKLVHSEKVLESIMTSNFALLERESVALTQVTKAPGWDVLKTPQYSQYSSEFLRAAEDLADAAKARNLDASALRYMTMTLTCYECHRYMKGARTARE